MGNAWFVDDIRFVESADEEIDVLRTLDLSKEAVADKQYESLLAGQVPTPTDSASTIVLTDYDSDFVTYAVDAKKDELALFSEVYYPKGWQVSIDGEPVEMLRANYTLRALPIQRETHGGVPFRTAKHPGDRWHCLHGPGHHTAHADCPYRSHSSRSAHHSQFFRFSVCVKG